MMLLANVIPVNQLQPMRIPGKKTRGKTTMRFIFLLLLSGISFQLPHMLIAQDTGSGQGVIQRRIIEQSIKDADSALTTKNYDVAVTQLERGLSVAKESRNAEMESVLNFKLGLAFQQQSSTLKDRRDLNNKAIAHYERFLVLKPNSGGAMNNLAQLHTKNNQLEQAKNLYKRAIGLEDKYKGLYALNLAELLASQGDASSAVPYYKLILAEHPDHPKAQKGLTEAYIQSDVSQLVTHLWDQLKEGRQADATLTALQALVRLSGSQQTDNRSIALQKTELLTCIVLGMGKSHVSPAFFQTGNRQLSPQKKKWRKFAQELQALSDDETIGDGVKELVSVFQNDGLENPFLWWAERGNSRRDPAEGWWPRDAFRLLLRSQGDWYKRRGNEPEAIKFYTKSVQLTQSVDNEPDLDALVNISEIYAKRGAFDKIGELLDLYSPDLFKGKGQAYRESKLRKIYAFHRTLGIMYGFTENWGNQDQVGSAFFQLEAAFRTRELINRSVQNQSLPEFIPVEPRLVNLLARGYMAEDNYKAAARLQIRYAGQLIQENDPVRAGEILEQVETEKLSRQNQRRYRALTARQVEQMKQTGSQE